MGRALKIGTPAVAAFSLLMISCSRVPSDAGAAPAASADPTAARKEQLNRVIPCCRALQELWAAHGGPFVRATQRCTLSFADIEAGRRTAPDVFKEIAEIVPAEKVPATCK